MTIYLTDRAPINDGESLGRHISERSGKSGGAAFQTVEDSDDHGAVYSGVGLETGIDGKLQPQGTANRAQAAVILQRFCVGLMGLS